MFGLVVLSWIVAYLLLRWCIRKKCESSDPPPREGAIALLIAFLGGLHAVVSHIILEVYGVGGMGWLGFGTLFPYLLAFNNGYLKYLQCPECKYKIRRKGEIISQEQQTYWDREERTMYNKYDEEIGHFYEDVQKVRTLSLVEYTCSHCNHKFRQWE